MPIYGHKKNNKIRKHCATQIIYYYATENSPAPSTYAQIQYSRKGQKTVTKILYKGKITHNKPSTPFGFHTNITKYGTYSSALALN